ncbi:hypothetical protein Tco_0998431 [Tanacetum coccineum]
MAKKSSIPAVDLSADDDNIEDEDDVVMTTTASTQTSVRWTRDEEKLLCEVWVGVSENNDIGNDRNEECFWRQIHDDFNKSTNGVSRTKNMITVKWNRMHPDCQKFHAIYKGITRKSADHFDSMDHTEIFDPDARPRLPGKTRPAKKTKSETTESSAGSGSMSMKDVLNEELRQKIQAGKSAYKAKKVKEQSATELNKLQFLTIDADSLLEPKKTIIKNKQAQIMAKYQL